MVFTRSPVSEFFFVDEPSTGDLSHCRSPTRRRSQPTRSHTMTDFETDPSCFDLRQRLSRPHNGPPNRRGGATVAWCDHRVARMLIFTRLWARLPCRTRWWCVSVPSIWLHVQP